MQGWIIDRDRNVVVRIHSGTFKRGEKYSNYNISFSIKKKLFKYYRLNPSCIVLDLPKNSFRLFSFFY